MNTPTPNPWLKYWDVLEVIEKITDTAKKGKPSAQSNREWFYWDGVRKAARAMRHSIADLAVTTPQPPTAEMVEARTLAWVLDRIDMMIDDLSSREEQAPGVMLLGLKTLRSELRNKQDKLLGG